MDMDNRSVSTLGSPNQKMADDDFDGVNQNFPDEIVRSIFTDF